MIIKNYNEIILKDIGYLPEERGLYKKMNVKEQCLYLAQLKDMPYDRAKNKLNYWFDKLNITNFLIKELNLVKEWLKKYNLSRQLFMNQNY